MANTSHDLQATCAFTPDATRLATLENDGVIRFWDMTGATPKETALVRRDKVPVLSVCFAPSGKRMATIHTDQTLQLWDVTATGASLGAVLKIQGQAGPVAFHPDGQMLAIGSSGTGLLFQIEPTGLKLRGDMKNAFHSYAFSPDGQMLATTLVGRLNGDGFGCDVKFWKVSGPKPVEFDVIQQERTIKALAYSPDGKVVATGSLDNQVRFWELGSPAKVKAEFNLSARPRSLHFTPDGAYLVAFSSRADIVLWNVREGKKERSWRIAPAPGPMGSGFSATTLAPDGRHVAVSMHSPQTIILRLPIASSLGAKPAP